jgi:hypothetical protein
MVHKPTDLFIYPIKKNFFFLFLTFFSFSFFLSHIMGVKQKPVQSAPANGISQPSEKDREREKRRRAAETNVGKEFQTVSFFFSLFIV